MKQVLFIENQKIFTNWASKTYEYKYNKLKNDDRFKVVDFDDDLDKIDPTDFNVVIFGWHATPIHKYYNGKTREYYKHKIEGLEKYTNVSRKLRKFMTIPRRCILVQDLHGNTYLEGLKGLINYTNKFMTDVISPYTDNSLYNEYVQSCPDINFNVCAHHIDTDHFKDRGEQKRFHILLFGNDTENTYPFRHRLFKLIEDNNTHFTVCRIPRIRNYFKYQDKFSNSNLSKIMNSSYLTVCTASKHDYLLGKYFETSMSGSVVLGNMPKQGDSIWNNNYIHVDDSMDDNQILNTIHDALENTTKLENIAQNMIRPMQKYSLDNYSQNLLDTLNIQSFAIADTQ